MTRLEKIQLAIEKGFTYDEVTGKIYSRFGREITRKNKGYIDINIYLDKKTYHLLGHQFAYYIKYGKVVEYIDHKDGNRSNNRINNLREVTHQQNIFNIKSVKGYTKSHNRFRAKIVLDNITIQLGRFNTEDEAKQAYLNAKKIYHKI